MAECLITGCAAVDNNKGAWKWGDLHEEGGAYIFVGVGAWEFSALNPATKAVIIDIHPNFSQLFEKRDIVVVSKSRCELNAAACKYLGLDGGEG